MVSYLINFIVLGKKLTVTEARRKFKSKEQILKENLKKLEIIQRTDKVNLEKEIVNQVSFYLPLVTNFQYLF